MRRLAIVIALATLLASSGGQTSPQNTRPAARTHDHEVLTIVRYVSAGGASGRTLEGPPILGLPTDLGPELRLRVRLDSYCAIVYGDGFFQFEGLVFTTADRSILEGHLPPHRVEALRRLLHSPEFLEQESDDRYTARLMHGRSEALDARVATDSGIRRFRWINAEDRQPMPDPAQDLMSWIENQPWAEFGALVRRNIPLCPVSLEPADRTPDRAAR